MNSALPFFLHSPTFPADDFTLPGLARDHKGLGSVARATLEKCLQPVLRGLEQMDAAALLDLTTLPASAEQPQGAQIAPG